MAGEPEPDGPGAARGQRLKNPPGRVHRVHGQPEGPGEDVGVTARQGGEQRCPIRRPVRAGAGRAGPEYSVDHLIHRAVPAQREHEPETLAGGSLRNVRGVSPVACLHNIQVEFRSQRVRDDLPPYRCGGRGVRVDDEQRAHALRLGGSTEMPHSPPTLRVAAVVQAAESVLILVATVLAGVDAAGGQSYHVNSGIALTVIGVAAVAALGFSST